MSTVENYFKSQKEYSEYYRYYSKLIPDEVNQFKWCVARILYKYPNKAKYCTPDLFDEVNGTMFLYNVPVFHIYDKVRI